MTTSIEGDIDRRKVTLRLEEETDAQLVARARTDDAHAFRRLVERYQPLAFHLALRMIGQEEIAHELVQEALLQAYLSLDRLRDDARFKSWLYGIVLNLCRNQRRLHPTSELPLDEEANLFEHPLSVDPQEIAEERELQQAVRSAIGILTPKNQAVAFLFYYEDLSMQEIANRLAISLSTVKNRLYKARQQIQAHLQSLYADLVSPGRSQRKRKTTLRLHLVKVVHRKQPFYESRYLLLLDEQKRRAWLPSVSDFRPPDTRMDLPTPQTKPSPEEDSSKLLVQMIHALEGKVEEIAIEELYEDLLYARVTLRGQNGQHIVKARLDDALRLVMHEQPPVTIAEAVFEYLSITLADYGQAQEQQLATIEQLVLDSPSLLCSRREPDNLDFSKGMRDWTCYNAHATLDTRVTRSGRPTLALTLPGEGALRGVGILSYQSFRAGKYRGKRVRATAYLRTDGVPQPIFSMSLDGSFPLPTGISSENQRMSYSTNSKSMQIVDMQAWTPHALVMDIPQETHTISFSFSTREQGNGTIWLAGIEFETVDDGVPLTDTYIGSLLLQPFNLDFSYGLSFWDAAGEDVWHYERRIDTTATQDGSPCAFVRSISAESTGPCTLQQMVRAQHYWGKSICLRASIKTVSAWRARFFVKCRLGDNEGCEEIINGNTDWTEYRLTLPIAVGTSYFVFGVALDGMGQFWLKNIQFQMEEEVF